MRFFAIGAALGIFTATSQAGTILKLSLDNSSTSHISFTDAGTLSTRDANVPGFTGDQKTAVDYQDFLSATADIPPFNASVTVNGILRAGTPTVFPGGLMMQKFSGGTVSLYDSTNTLLLSGSLNDSALAGALGPPGTNALFTTSFNLVTGGTLASQIDPSSVALKMNITGVNGGSGFTVASPGGALNPFTAAAIFTLTGEVIPEPTAVMLCALAITIAGLLSGRRR
jgi:hypothetical protein